ncbi:CcmD family protein [Hydrotalea sp.]|uniref:CcmD family protein n=1 Tax=Hydrotalea sp. TaxID=2881279 RepID=UPI0026288C81|nr:CcmD family protein [Hydrotalea sp.]
MRKKIKFLMFSLCLFLWNNMLMAQTNTPDDGSFMKSNGKIYVVMAVVVVIVLGLFIYLIALDRQIRRIEKK